MVTVAETIRNITHDHLANNNGVALGQCLTAVGWVGGTVPEMTRGQGIFELSMDDTAGGGIATGLALAHRRPIYIIRYQGFLWYNLPEIVNYAAKSKELWGIPCPVFVRAIAMDGGGIGPVASSSHHSLATRMPGIAVCAPMTPKEYESVWKWFMDHDDPICVSEHRKSFLIDYEMHDITHPSGADITLLPISSTRLNAIEAAKKLADEGITCNISHVLWLKPFHIMLGMRFALEHSQHGGLVIDGDYENGVAKSIAFDLMHATGKPVHVLGLEDRTSGFAPHLENLPPTTDKIIHKVKHIISK